MFPAEVDIVPTHSRKGLEESGQSEGKHALPCKEKKESPQDHDGGDERTWKTTRTTQMVGQTGGCLHASKPPSGEYMTNATVAQTITYNLYLTSLLMLPESACGGGKLRRYGSLCNRTSILTFEEEYQRYHSNLLERQRQRHMSAWAKARSP